MYRISERKSFKVKTHYCSNILLAEKVAKYLKKEYDADCCIEIVDNKDFVFDPGGSILANDNWITLILSDLNIKIRHIHFDCFDNEYSYMLSNIGKKEFNKVYGHRYILALTDKEVKELIQAWECNRKEYMEQFRKEEERIGGVFVDINNFKVGEQ